MGRSEFPSHGWMYASSLLFRCFENACSLGARASEVERLVLHLLSFSSAIDSVLEEVA